MSAGAVSAPPAAVAAPSPPPILLAQAITKRFGGLIAVNAVTFDIPARSIVSLIGPNGAGKTTFFNMLTGLIRPTEGRVSLDGRNITRCRPDVITARGVARTFQNIRLFGAMTATENVMIGHHSRRLRCHRPAAVGDEGRARGG
jgi:branched-chain amino acid transport system ATP-binding protein